MGRLLQLYSDMNSDSDYDNNDIHKQNKRVNCARNSSPTINLSQRSTLRSRIKPILLNGRPLTPTNAKTKMWMVTAWPYVLCLKTLNASRIHWLNIWNREGWHHRVQDIDVIFHYQIHRQVHIQIHRSSKDISEKDSVLSILHVGDADDEEKLEEEIVSSEDEWTKIKRKK